MKFTNGHFCVLVLIAVIAVFAVGSSNVDTYNDAVMKITAHADK